MVSSWTRDRSDVPCISRQILNHWTTREVWVIYFKSDNYLVVILIFSGGNFNHLLPPNLYVSFNITWLSGFSVPQVVIAKCLPSHVSSLIMSCRCSSQMCHSSWLHHHPPHTYTLQLWLDECSRNIIFPLETTEPGIVCVGSSVKLLTFLEFNISNEEIFLKIQVSTLTSK